MVDDETPMAAERGTLAPATHTLEVPCRQAEIERRARRIEKGPFSRAVLVMLRHGVVPKTGSSGPLSPATGRHGRVVTGGGANSTLRGTYMSRPPASPR